MCRRILRRGATPAVLRLYDATESARNFEVTGPAARSSSSTKPIEGLLDADALAIVDDECGRRGARARSTTALVERWMGHRNDVSALAPLYRAGIVVDTIEIAARLGGAPRPLRRLASPRCWRIEGTLAASAHQSHAYVDGACLYFTFAGRVPEGPAPSPPATAPRRHGPRPTPGPSGYYTAAWGAVMEAVRAHGGAISHHHGVGSTGAASWPTPSGGAFDVLVALKETPRPPRHPQPRASSGCRRPSARSAWP